MDWYYTQKTPNGLDATKVLSNSNYTFDEITMTATVTLSEQAAAGATGTWNYIMGHSKPRQTAKPLCW